MFKQELEPELVAVFAKSLCFTVFVKESIQRSSDGNSEAFSRGLEGCIRVTSWQDWVKRSHKLQGEPLAHGPKVI